MKKHIIILALLGFQTAFSHVEKDSIWPRPVQLRLEPRFHFDRTMLEDCDACGCSANGGSMGFSSVFNNNFIGLRYFYQSYTSKDGIFNNSPWVDEDFNTVQVWARIPIVKKIQLSVLVPYHFHTRERSSGDEKIEGLGDATVLAMYSVYETTKDSTVLTHKLQLGGGVKAPTGKFDSENNKGSVNPGFQVGTGSWDYLLASEYVIKKANLGLNVMANYTLKTENKKLYQFGNQFNYSGTFFYLFEQKAIKLVPQAGIAGEVFEANSQYKQKVPDSKGDIVFGKLGLEAGRKDLSVGLNLMLPIRQNLSSGNVESNYRWSINLNYTL